MSACDICFDVSSDLGVPACCVRKGREPVNFRMCKKCFVKVSLCIATGRFGVWLLRFSRF